MWEFLERYLFHRVPVKTLIDREFDVKESLVHGTLPSAKIFREEVTNQCLDPNNNGYSTSLNLGLLARRSGARARLSQIALQLLRECSHVRDIDDIRDVDEGIDTDIIDWWLTGLDSSHACRQHCVWALRTEKNLEMG